MFWNTERSPGVRLTRHQSKRAAVHRYACDVAVDAVRDLRPAEVRLTGGSVPSDGALHCDADTVCGIFE